MMQTNLDDLITQIRDMEPVSRSGHVTRVSSGYADVTGLSVAARLGDAVRIQSGAVTTGGEVISLDQKTVTVMTFDPEAELAVGDPVVLTGRATLKPAESWIGRLIDPLGQPLDGRPLQVGPRAVPLRAKAPPSGRRKALGERIGTGVAALDTMLPLVRGQRIGVFAGSGVGKTTLLGHLAGAMEADCAVIGLIGERGREVREFVEKSLGPAGLARSVVVAATSDQSPLLKRRAAWTATAIAEHFRDQGKHVLLILDSLTRFAEAHREIALTAGEPPSLRAYPPSTASMISALVERAGPGAEGSGDITAVFSVLVAGSDMEEPVADITRGVLDGHVILDRAIAERGRFPAIDVRRSVSRSLPEAASAEENTLIDTARAHLARYESAEALIQTGLYTPGADAALDRSVQVWPGLDAFCARMDTQTPPKAFESLRMVLGL